ncbi:TlpA family protein disulfide reductase [Cellulophaga sp. F20128]|uniref:TlpA family protein disulfide reductase n=1 Tax=Cellulophaga sp. F20128 TaxID=2926413 RepID=UPI001FF653F4|nr:TlpA disulfide reductase family protein [Cellulophaga sp. F20128]MCK0156903.1 TlpA family protein disulfide reductase [Cellulophaga sp. F20128]
MRKTFYILGLAGISLASCTEETPINYAIVSGKIANATSNQLLVASTLNRKQTDTLALGADGSFTDTIQSPKGQYTIVNDKNRATIYLEKGYDITFNADAKDFKNSIAYTGVGSLENDFLRAKATKETAFKGGENPYTLEETAFKEKFNTHKTELNSLLDNTQSISESFKTAQKKDINYSYLSALSNYESYHRHYAKKPDYKMSEGFLSELDVLDFENDEDYENSNAYKALVRSNHSQVASSLSKKDSIDFYLASLLTSSKIKSDKIKNDFLSQATTYITYTGDLEAYYTAFKEVATDKDLIAKIDAQYANLKVLTKGNPSPKFVAYENNAGGTTSLDDLKGKFVYIDVWATWCGPCLAEIPSLKEIEKTYHNKNIEFVSISVDRPDAYDKWKQMIVDRELGGIQLIADNNFSSDFVQEYVIKGIPKFILLDPKGTIVNANAPRPSDPKLKEVLNNLL